MGVSRMVSVLQCNGMMKPASVNTDAGASLIYVSGLIASEQPEPRQRCKGGAGSRTGGAEGLPGCTSEALGARKLGRGRAERRRVSLMPRGIHPRLFASGARRGVKRPAGPERSAARSRCPLRIFGRVRLTTLGFIIYDGKSVFNAEHCFGNIDQPGRPVLA